MRYDRYRNRRALAKQESTEVTEGSLADQAKTLDKPIAEVFANAKVIILLDESISMETCDVGEKARPMFGEYDYDNKGPSRHDAAEEQVRKLQAKYPGQVALFGFSDETKFRPNGVPGRMNHSTNLTVGLEVIKEADASGMQISVISDGEPDNEETALEIARRFETKIDCIYIGSHGGYGEEFMQRLAAESGGVYVRTEEVGEFYDDQETLLLAATRS